MVTIEFRPLFEWCVLSGGALLLFLGACTAPPTAAPTPEPEAPPSILGSWRAVLDSPGGELPFGLLIDLTDDGMAAWALNGEERAPFSGVEQDGRTVRLAFDFYDSAIEAEVGPHGQNMFGYWRRTDPGGGLTEMRFLAERNRTERFGPTLDPPSEVEGPDSVDGRWAALIADEDGKHQAVAELHQAGGSSRVTGTFLTPIGDYRYLEGSYRDGLLELSAFDGAHAFLFTARAREDGSLEGRFWSRNSYAASWTALRAAPTAVILPDPWEEVGLANDDGRLHFAFPDLEGNQVTSEDERFRGKAMVVNVFGSWCPNCNDEAPLLAEWYRRHRGAGLEIVGLAYEFTGERGRDARQVRRFAERHGIEYTLLLAGTSDKEVASKTLPDLTSVLSYPTTIFMDRNGIVRKIHSGYAGPGTGAHHRELVAELEAALREILASS